MTERLSIPLICPGGPEYTMVAARIVGLTASSHCLDVGAGYGHAAITLAREIGCSVVAFDRLPERVRAARTHAEIYGVTDRVQFETRELARIIYPPDTFDFILAECGVASSPPNPEPTLARLITMLRPGGALVLSNLVYSISPPPDEVRDRFPQLWTERRYTTTLETLGLEIPFLCWIARRGWRAFLSTAREQREFWESRDARAGLGYVYIVAIKPI